MKYLSHSQRNYPDVKNQRQFCKPHRNGTQNERQVLLLQTPARRQSLFDFPQGE